MNNPKDNQQQPQNPMSPPYPYYAPPQVDEINLLDLLKMLVEQKKLIFIITTISTLVALAYALLATPIYRAEALLAPVEKEKGGGLGALAGQFGGLASLAGINLGGGGGSIEEAIATLKSRVLTNEFIVEENIMPILFENKWDTISKQWKDNKKQPTLWDAYNKFDKSIRIITKNVKTGLIILTIDWKEPELAADWVGKLVTRANDKLRKEAIIDAEKSIAYLNSELTKTSNIEIKQSIYSLIEAQTKNKMLANTQQEYAFRVLDPAVPPQDRVKPKRMLIVISGFILGLIVGIFIAFFNKMRESRNGGV